MVEPRGLTPSVRDGDWRLAATYRGATCGGDIAGDMGEKVMNDTTAWVTALAEARGRPVGVAIDGVNDDVGNVDGVFVNNWIENALDGFFYEIDYDERAIEVRTSPLTAEQAKKDATALYEAKQNRNQTQRKQQLRKVQQKK